MRSRASLLLAGCCVLAAVPQAHAANFIQSGLTYLGDNGANQVSLTYGNTLSTVRFTEAAATIQDASSGGCVEAAGSNSHSYDCADAEATLINLVLNGGTDSFSSPVMLYRPVRINAGPGIDTVNAGQTNDEIHGGSATDIIDGGSGDDVIDDLEFGFNSPTEGGSDIENGGPGDDTIIARSGGDHIDGGTGTDTLDYSARTTPLTVTVDDGNANDGTTTGEGDEVLGIERLLGGSANDKLTAGNAGSRLIGGAGSDTLTGGNGDDDLRGGDREGSVGSGNDLLDGGAGADELRGGDGIDTVSYAKRSAGVTISPDDKADDGETGEKDNVRSDVETLIGGSGNDVFNVRNNRSEIISCGAGTDTVVADNIDDIVDDCENVDGATVRPETPAPVTVTVPGPTVTVPGPTVTTPVPTPLPAATLSVLTTRAKPDRRGRLAVKLRCGPGSGCAGTLTLKLKGKAAAAKLTYVLKPGQTATVRFQLTRAARKARRPTYALSTGAAIGKPVAATIKPA